VFFCVLFFVCISLWIRNVLLQWNFRILSICRTELNTSSPRRISLELFDYFCVFFFCKKFGSIEPNMIYSGDEDDFLQKNIKIIKKFGTKSKSEIINNCFVYKPSWIAHINHYDFLKIWINKKIPKNFIKLAK